MNEDQKQEPAMRFDGDKVRYDLVWWPAVMQMAMVFTGGAGKYADHNWKKGMSWSRMLASMLRHILSFWIFRKSNNDSDFGLHNMAHVMWNAQALMFYDYMKKQDPEVYTKFDDRGEDPYTFFAAMYEDKLNIALSELREEKKE